MRAATAVALAQSAEQRNVDPQVRGSRPLGHPNSLPALRVVARVVADRVECPRQPRPDGLLVSALVAGPRRASEAWVGMLDAAAAELDELLGAGDDAAVAEPVDRAALRKIGRAHV